MKTCYVALSVMLLSGNAFAQVVVVRDNLDFVARSDPSLGSNHDGSIYQDSARTDVTAAFFDYDGANLTAVSTLLDEGSDWYLVEQGDPFGFDTIRERRFTPVLDDLTYQVPVFVGSDEFFLGVSTDGEGFDVPYPTRNVFGWVHLRNEAGQLSMVDNAVAYNSLGIFVGTTQVVPEPAGITIAWLALGSVLIHRSRRSTNVRG